MVGGKERSDQKMLPDRYTITPLISIPSRQRFFIFGLATNQTQPSSFVTQADQAW